MHDLPDSNELPLEGAGVHIRGVLMRADNDPSVCCLRIEVYPLPDLDELHHACHEAAATAIREFLLAAGVIGEGLTKIPTAKGPMQ